MHSNFPAMIFHNYFKFCCPITIQPRGNVTLARIFLSSDEFDSIVSQVHLLFYNTNSEKLQWIYTHRPCLSIN